MAQTFATSSGTLIIPGVYSTITVQSANAGLATNGVVVLMGEADGGLDYTQETDLQANAFGPSQFAAVQAKYLSGNIVNAFNLVAQPSNDPQIPGSPSSIIIVKTNPSTAASANLLNPDTTVYAPLTAIIPSDLGNLIYFSVVAATTEVLPTTGAFTFVNPAGSANLGLSVNGVNTSVSVPANTAPDAFVTAVNGATAGVTATGGAVRQYVTASGTLTVAASSNVVTITRSVNWNITPAIGDTLTISSTSAIAGAGSANVGTYVVTASTPTTVTATKRSDGAAGATGTPGTITAPVNVSAQFIVSTTADVQGFSQVTVTNNSATLVQGLSKSLEFAELTTGTDLISRYVFSANTPVSYISKSGAAKLITGTEQRVTTNVSRSFDLVQETWTVGGEVVLSVSYKGTSGTITIAASGATTTVAGGLGANLSFAFSQGGKIPTIADLANYINNQTDYSASVGTTAIGQLLCTALDKGTFAINSFFNAHNGRVKDDAYRYAQAVLSNSTVVKESQATAGLPAVQTVTFLTGGDKGGTSDANVLNALVALQSVQCNFIVPLFSRDASIDINNGLTDPLSTYTITAINANVRSHVLLMSTLKRKRNRQGFLSIQDTFANAKNAAANIASDRCSMNFQDVKVPAVTGGIVQFAPWMGAVCAAGMQAAGFYRPIVNKFLNISGAIQAAGDFNDQDQDAMESALTAGLLPIQRAPTGGFIWVSDQSTYGKDNNFVFNSIQARYVSDVVALSSAQSMQTAFIGQSLADVSPSILLSFFEALMANFVRLKLLAPSSDAPAGYKNASVTITGPVFVVNAEIKVASGLYFGLLNFLVSQVTGSAQQAASTPSV